MTTKKLSFMERLKRHHIFRVASLYATVAWVLILVANQVFPNIGLTHVATRALIVALALGFPVALALGWTFITPSDVDPKKLSRWRKLRWRLGGAVSLVAILLAAGSGIYLWRVNERLPGASLSSGDIPSKSIAVLPFENMSKDADNAYFASGMQDMILTKLAGIKDLKVISRTSTEKYASHPDNLKDVGAALGVATILEGSVQRSGGQVLINVQLIDAATDSHLWAEAYTRSLDDMFGVEGEVAGIVADKLDAKLAGSEQETLAAKPTQDSKAYDLFLRAEYERDQGALNGDPKAIRAAVDLYRQAVTRDPQFALAYARLAILEAGTYWYNGFPDWSLQQIATDARAHTDKALALAPDLADSNLAMGYYQYRVNLDYAAALVSFNKALATRPNDADAIGATAYAYRRQGKWDQAVQQMEKAAALDPKNALWTSDLADFYADVRRYADADVTYQRAMALDNGTSAPTYANMILYGLGDVPRALSVLQGDDLSLRFSTSQVLPYQRKFKEALAVLEAIPEPSKVFNAGASSKAFFRGQLHEWDGDGAQARADFATAESQLQRAIAAAPADFVNLPYMHTNLAYAQAGLGETAAALANAQKALNEMPLSRDHHTATAVMAYVSAVYALAKRPDLAVPLIDKLMTLPGAGTDMTPAELALDPVWDPIRKDPGFQALLQKYPFTAPKS